MPPAERAMFGRLIVDWHYPKMGLCVSGYRRASPPGMIKNRISIEHLKLACRHVQELIAAGVSENLAIRTLELFADVYASTGAETAAQ